MWKRGGSTKGFRTGGKVTMSGGLGGTEMDGNGVQREKSAVAGDVDILVEDEEREIERNEEFVLFFFIFSLVLFVFRCF